MVTAVLGDPCSFEVNFELEPMEEPGNNIIEKTVISFYIEENGSNALLDITSTTVSSILQLLNFQTGFYQLTSELNAVLGSIMNIPIFDGDAPIIISIGGPDQCETVTMEFEYFVTDVGWCFYEEEVEICTPDYEAPETTVVCSQTTDVNDCPATVPLVGTPINPGVCNPEPYYTSVSPDGSFCIQVPVGGCVELEVEDCDKICGPSGGITGRDVVDLRRLILGIINGVSSNPYAQVLADVNCDGTISTLDLVLIQRFILGFPPVDEGCQPGDCIVFDPSSPTYDDNGDLIPSSVKTTFCDGDDIASFVVGRMGDINGSCSCDDFRAFDDGGGSTELLYKNDIVGLNTTGVYDIALSLAFDRPVTLDDVEVLLEGTEVHTNGSTLKLAFSAGSNMHQSNDHIEIVRIVGSDLQLTDVQSESFTVTSDVNLSHIVLQEDLKERSSASDRGLSDLQTYVRGSAIVVVGLTEAEDATLIVYNLSGQVILRSSVDYTNNVVELPSNVLSGMYFTAVHGSDRYIATKIWLP